MDNFDKLIIQKETYPKTIISIISILCLIIGSIIFFLMKSFKQIGVNEWSINSSDNEKLLRTKTRGTIISIILVSLSIIQAVLKGFGAAKTPLLLLYGFIFAIIILI